MKRIVLILGLLLAAGAARAQQDAQVCCNYNSTATAITLVQGQGSQLPNVAFVAVWWNSTNYFSPGDDPQAETIFVYARSGDVLSPIRRGYGTPAFNHIAPPFSIFKVRVVGMFPANTPTITPTPTNTFTPTRTPTPTFTPTLTPTFTTTPVPTSTFTLTPTPTPTPNGNTIYQGGSNGVPSLGIVTYNANGQAITNIIGVGSNGVCNLIDFTGGNITFQTFGTISFDTGGCGNNVASFAGNEFRVGQNINFQNFGVGVINAVDPTTAQGYKTVHYDSVNAGMVTLTAGAATVTGMSGVTSSSIPQVSYRVLQGSQTTFLAVKPGSNSITITAGAGDTSIVNYSIAAR